MFCQQGQFAQGHSHKLFKAWSLIKNHSLHRNSVEAKHNNN